MNHKKWRSKFACNDSSRYLKRHEPAYSAPHLSQNYYTKVLYAVRAYPALEAEKQQLIRERLSTLRHGRAVEDALTWRLPSAAERQHKAITSAIAMCLRMDHGHTAVRLIQHRYWSGAPVEPSIATAAKELDISKGRAQQLERMFFGIVAKNMGCELFLFAIQRRNV